MRAVRAAVVFSLLAASGCHWALVQGFAWARMAYLERFDPCSICVMVDEAVAQSGPSLAAPQAQRAELFFEARPEPLVPASMPYAAFSVVAAPRDGTPSSFLRPPRRLA